MRDLKSHEPNDSGQSFWSAFRHRAFAIIWTATVVSNIGTWMYNAASGWLMTGLDASPMTVSLIQVASSLPMFLFALPAGALADIVDRRRFLIYAEISVTIVAAASAVLVRLDIITPFLLLLCTFLLSIGAALTAPAWQSIVPQLVPRRDLPAAVAGNGVGINISRAIGPALAGVVIGAFGNAAPFWLNAASNFAVIGALLWWRPPANTEHALPAERLMSALIIGFRHARYNRPLRATLMRAAFFFFFASAYWALLPLIARSQIESGPAIYGMLLGAIGLGAVIGALALPRLRRALDADGLVILGSCGTAATLATLGLARSPTPALAACVLAGFSWILVIATLNVSAQISLPDWVRGRGLAMFATGFFGAMTLGSAVWGQIATMLDLSTTNYVAAAGLLFGILPSRRWKLSAGAGTDLTPSMHWPNPVISINAEADRGPVMISVEYSVDSQHRDAFLQAVRELGEGRRRDGAYAWDIFEDVAQEGRFIEIFYVASWLEHLRQHRRVTNADRILQEMVRQFGADQEPKVTHLIAASSSASGSERIAS